MQVYRHPDQENCLLLSVKDSPMTHNILRNSQFASEMEYHPHHEWYSMTNETYQNLRRFLLKPSSLLPSTPKRPRPKEEEIRSPPAERETKNCRTLQVQTDPPPLQKHTGTQTKEEATEAVIVGEPEPEPESVVVLLPVPSVIEQPVSLLSPSQIVHVKEVELEETEVIGNTIDVVRAPAPPPSVGQSVVSGYMDWKDVCLRRLLVRDMLRERE